MQTTKSFYHKVLQIVRQIPPGKITTYGAIAECLGNKRSARMVGWVLNSQKGNSDIPAHRVVNKQGLLTGKIHFEGVNLMQQLLENEGIEVTNDRIVNMEKYFWNPCLHLNKIRL